MKKKILLPIIVIIIFGTGFYLLKNYAVETPSTEKQEKEVVTSSEKIIENTTDEELLFEAFTASFEIYTSGTKRIFTDPMYHNQSPDFYIENPDPSIIFVKKRGTTWSDFFKTLPFSITKDCLVTGTQQTFCSNETQQLRFFLNEIEDPNALDKVINANDSLKILYGN